MPGGNRRLQSSQAVSASDFNCARPFQKSPPTIFVAVHEQAECLGHEVAFARHRPGDHGLRAGGLEGELHRVGRFEGFQEFQRQSISSWDGSR